ncbi:MAG: ABC transporter permease [Cytophagia bacterium]|nr:ABC transporter permease [Cytophagia bacterium]
MNKHTPKFFTRLLSWFCHDDFYEEIQGDLEESFIKNTNTRGLRKARAIYRKEVLKLLRPSVVKAFRVRFSIIQFSLLLIHLKLSFRNLMRNKVFSTVNVLGLAAAITVGLFVLNILYTGLKMDSHHNNSENIYRVTSRVEQQNLGNVQFFASSPAPLSEKLRSEIPDTESVTTFLFLPNQKFHFRGEEMELNHIVSDQYFFNVFDFKSIYGNLRNALEQPNSAVITETLAERYYPGENPIGETLSSGQVISAVVESPQGKSHLDFDILSTNDKEETRYSSLENYSNFYLSYNYFKVLDGTNQAIIDQKLEGVSTDVNSKVKENSLHFSFRSQKLRDIYFGDELYNEPGTVFPSFMLYFLISLITILLLLASFNYTNLSIARAVQRSKEIGIRKVVGSSKKQIVSQILTETLVFSSLAGIIGILVYKGLSPSFEGMVSQNVGLIFNPNLNTELYLIFIAFSLLVGFVSGIIPALFSAKISPLNAINSRIKNKALSLSVLRKGLVTIQLIVSIFCVGVVTSGMGSYNAILNANYGFDKENIVIVRTEAKNTELLKEKYKTVAGVEAVSIGSSIPGVTPRGLTLVYKPQLKDSIESYFAIVDDSFEDVFKPKLFTGSSFSYKSSDSTLTEVWVNQSLLERFKIPLDSALGYTLANWKGVEQYRIVGITNSLTFETLESDRIHPLLIMPGASPTSSPLAIRLALESPQETLELLNQATKEVDEEQAFNPVFLTDTIREKYSILKNLISVLKFIALIVVSIALLGQLGIALYSAETRIKEIGIRKVLGSSTNKIIQLLLKGTLISLLVAMVIALPLSYLFIKNTFWNGLALKVQNEFLALTWGNLLLAGLLVVIVISQTYQVASSNPSKSLRNE